MPGILSDIGQFLHAPRNENVKRVADPLKLKRGAEINNPLLPKEDGQLFTYKRANVVESKSAREDKESKLFQSGRLEISNMGYKFWGGEWGL